MFFADVRVGEPAFVCLFLFFSMLPQGPSVYLELSVLGCTLVPGPQAASYHFLKRQDWQDAFRFLELFFRWCV